MLHVRSIRRCRPLDTAKGKAFLRLWDLFQFNEGTCSFRLYIR